MDIVYYIYIILYIYYIYMLYIYHIYILFIYTLYVYCIIYIGGSPADLSISYRESTPSKYILEIVDCISMESSDKDESRSPGSLYGSQATYRVIGR